MKKTTFLLLTALMLASCVEEYTISSKKVSSVVDNTIVIQGRVLSVPTHVPKLVFHDSSTFD